VSKKPTLLILAAGLSNRYKLGLKQLDRFGPSGETLLDYAIYDAVEAGFGKVFFVIRNEIKDDFEKQVTVNYRNKIVYDFVSQETDDLPVDFESPVLRIKPWGTGHAVWVARNVITEPFAVINADDFYGKESYRIMAKFLQQQNTISEKYAMAGFNLQNTVSDFGTVSRGICKVQNSNLIDIDERTSIRQSQDGNIVYKTEQGQQYALDPDSIVSMNFWGFYPGFFDRLEQSFKVFLKQNINDLKMEFYLPQCVKEHIKLKNIKVEVLKSPGKWLGITHPDDKPVVKAKLKSYCDAGLYPTPLF
jgi:UTP-glucose-1-phosphate uridylyltransferase